MSNGYLVTSSADLAVAREIGEGFGLDVVDAAVIGDHGAFAGALAAAPNVGLLISAAASIDDAFVSLLRSATLRLQSAQIILADEDARAAFAFLPHQWPVMTLSEARNRAARRREASQAPAPDIPRAAPITPPPPPSPEPAPPPVQAAPEPAPEAAPEPAPPPEPGPDLGAIEPPREDAIVADEDALPIGGVTEDGARDDAMLSAEEEQAPAATAPPAEAPPQVAAKRSAPRSETFGAGMGNGMPQPTAPADATAFAPKKLRRGEAELVRIVIHQPKQLKEVIKAARQIDPRSEPAPQGMSIGEVAIGAQVGVALDVRGAACDGAIQRRTWTGEPIDFSYAIEAEQDAKQLVFLARVFVDEAQIGVLAFTRKVSGPAKKPAASGDVRLTRHKRVFLSYSSVDRETVSVIATAYERAGVPHFWDRTALKSGEEWSPRLRKEIDRADLFHLCWSKSAAQSEWVEKEAEHALNTRRRKKKPEITVQMLDGPPWAPHPAHLDAINFDDFVRAAIVGYQRGEA